MINPLPFVLAVVAAFCFAWAAVLQHRAVAAEPGPLAGALALRGLRDVTRSPVWRLGLLLAAGGSALHAVALVFAPLSVIQPVGVLAVPIAVLLAAAHARRKPTGGMLAGVLLSGTCVATFVMTAASSVVGTPAAGADIALAGIVVALVLLVLAGVGLACTGWARCVTSAMAGATAFGLVSALVRAVSQTFTSGQVGILDATVVIGVMAVVAAVLTGGWLVQQAFAAGPPEVVVCCLTVVDPIVAVLFGVVLLGEGNALAAQWAVLLTAAIGAIVGVAVLTRHHPEAAARQIRAPYPQVSRGTDFLPSALRVLIVAETYPPDVNGAARFAERLAGGLAGRGHEVHVVAPSPDGAPGTAVHDAGGGKITVHRVRSRPYFRRPDFRMCTPWEARPVTAALLAEINPDVVHTQSAWMVGRYAVRAAVRSDMPLVATHHVMPENLTAHVPLPRPVRPLLYRLLWKDLARVLSRVDVVTAPTPRAVELLIGSSGLTEAIPVSNGVDIEHYYRDPEPGPVPTILYVGRMDQEKRVDELIRAFAALPAGLPAALELVGDGPERATWTALAVELGVADRVRFHGFVPEGELVAAYARAAVFCMPGIAELQSLVTLEAMAAGNPVIAADAMALPHLVRPGRNGWLYQPGDVGELTGHLATLLGDPALRERMGAASQELVGEHAIEATLDRYEGIYRDLIARSRVAVRRRLTSTARSNRSSSTRAERSHE